MGARGAALGLPYMQNIDNWLRLLMNSGRPALLISRAELNLLSRGFSNGKVLISILVDDILLLLTLHLLIVGILVEHGCVLAVGIVDAENTVPPPGLEYSVPLAEEHLLCLELAELLELGLDVLEFLPSLPGHAHLARVDHEFVLSVLKFSDLFIDVLYVFLPLDLVKQRLFGLGLPKRGYSVPLLQRRGPIVLVHVYLLRRVLPVHRHERDTRSHHRRVHRVRASLQRLRMLRIVRRTSVR